MASPRCKEPLLFVPFIWKCLRKSDREPSGVDSSTVAVLPPTIGVLPYNDFSHSTALFGEFSHNCTLARLAVEPLVELYPFATFGVAGGDDGARTRNLMRDRHAEHFF
jgi:hypothetical protein